MAEINSDKLTPLTIIEKIKSFGCLINGPEAKFTFEEAANFLDRRVSEFGVQSPSTESITKKIAQKVNSIYMDMWGAFMPAEGKEIKSQSALRPINTDREGIKQSHIVRDSLLHRIVGRIHELSSAVMADTSYIGNIRIIHIPGLGEAIDRNRLLSGSTLGEIAKTMFKGDKVQAEEWFNLWMYTKLLSHEMAHVYETDKSLNLINELGAHYYQDEVTTKLFGQTQPYDANSDAACKIYQKLIAKYGDDVHRIFFGMPVSVSVKRKILFEGTIREIFQ